MTLSEKGRSPDRWLTRLKRQLQGPVYPPRWSYPNPPWPPLRSYEKKMQQKYGEMR